MPGQVPDKIRLFRLVHRDNVAHLLRHGLCTRAHPQADPDYISIGDNHLIGQRDDYLVGINPPNGHLGAYIPFYFGPLSPMLLNIKTGFRDIMPRPQNEIVYICCELRQIVATCAAWCFTDGHAKNSITAFFNDLANLDKVDWDMCSSDTGATRTTTTTGCGASKRNFWSKTTYLRLVFVA
jgi:hypothetical protein